MQPGREVWTPGGGTYEGWGSERRSGREGEDGAEAVPREELGTTPQPQLATSPSPHDVLNAVNWAWGPWKYKLVGQEIQIIFKIGKQMEIKIISYQRVGGEMIGYFLN